VLATAFTAAFNHVMRGQALSHRIHDLNGKRVRLCASDMPWTLDLQVNAGKLCAANSTQEPDVTIRGSLADLRRLATRREDADTLFFERRLCLEGETQTGLLVKNMLDALDWDLEAHLRSVLPPPIASLAFAACQRLRQAVSIPGAPRKYPSQ
jgi:predicted lipid carrier protein YhbT